MPARVWVAEKPAQGHARSVDDDWEMSRLLETETLF
jgi:hypothetical protein